MNVVFHPKVDCSEILCVGFSNSKNPILLSNFLYMVWIKSYFYVETNVEMSCLNWNNLGVINCIEIVAISAPPQKEERKHSFLVTSPGIEKQLRQIFLLL